MRPSYLAPIETERLILRMPVGDDAQAMMEIHEDPEAREHVTLTSNQGGLTMAWRNVSMMVGHWQLRGYGQWTVEDRFTHEVVARVGIYHPPTRPEAELGWIVRRSQWGNGIATEAAIAALTWVWRYTSLDRIISLIESKNLASIRLAAKVGLRYEIDTILDGRQVRLYALTRPACVTA